MSWIPTAFVGPHRYLFLRFYYLIKHLQHNRTTSIKTERKNVKDKLKACLEFRSVIVASYTAKSYDSFEKMIKY